MKVLLTGGGTAGHINPALAIAGIIKEKHKDAEFLFIGNKDGMEEKLVPNAGYNMKTIIISGFRRKINAKNIVHNIKTISRLWSSSAASKKIIKEFNPDVCIATGGYVSGPVMRAAAKLNIPCVIHESNAFPGVTSKLLSKDMNAILIAVEDARKYFNADLNVQVTGNPIRNEFFKYTKQEARQILGLDERPLVVSAGGSLGAERLNEHIIQVFKDSIKSGEIQHIHSAGYSKITDEMREIKEQNANNVQIMEYINMPLCLAAADVIICRAGAMTITEVSAAGKASILIPSPYVAENHQFHNAMSLVNVGAAEIIEEKNLNSQILSDKIKKVLSSKEKAEEMGKNARKIYVENTDEKIYSAIIKEVKKNLTTNS